MIKQVDWLNSSYRPIFNLRAIFALLLYSHYESFFKLGGLYILSYDQIKAKNDIHIFRRSNRARLVRSTGGLVYPTGDHLRGPGQKSGDAARPLNPRDHVLALLRQEKLREPERDAFRPGHCRQVICTLDLCLECASAFNTRLIKTAFHPWYTMVINHIPRERTTSKSIRSFKKLYVPCSS